MVGDCGGGGGAVCCQDLCPLSWCGYWWDSRKKRSLVNTLLFPARLGHHLFSEHTLPFYLDCLCSCIPHGLKCLLSVPSTPGKSYPYLLQTPFSPGSFLWLSGQKRLPSSEHGENLVCSSVPTLPCACLFFSVPCPSVTTSSMWCAQLHYPS